MIKSNDSLERKSVNINILISLFFKKLHIWLSDGSILTIESQICVCQGSQTAMEYVGFNVQRRYGGVFLPYRRYITC